MALSQQLATIDCQLTLKVHPDALIRQAADKVTLSELYQRLEFNGLLASIDATALPVVEADEAPTPPP